MKKKIKRKIDLMLLKWDEQKHGKRIEHALSIIIQPVIIRKKPLLMTNIGFNNKRIIITTY